MAIPSFDGKHFADSQLAPVRDDYAEIIRPHQYNQ